MIGPFGFQLFWGSIWTRITINAAARRRRRRAFRQPEIEQHDSAVRPELHIVRFDVAVNDGRLMLQKAN